MKDDATAQADEKSRAKELLQEIAQLPIEFIADDFSTRDHDCVLYGKDGQAL